MMLVALAAIGLLLHGMLHLVGFYLPWRYAALRPLHANDVGGGRLRLSDTGSRTLGLLWLVVAVTYVVAAGLLLVGPELATGLIVVATLGSLTLCVAKLPDMAVGLLVDLIILAITVPILVTGTPLLS